MVELVLVLPALVAILLGIVQFGTIYNSYVTITDATRAGARMAAVSRSAADPSGAAMRDSAGNLNQSKLAVTISPGPPWTSGEQVTVTATYPYAVNLAGIVVKTGTLTSTTKERIE